MTDFTFDEGLAIGSFLTGLVVSLATWIFFGLIGADLGYRVNVTIIAFGVSVFGVIFLALPTATRKTIEKRKQTTPKLKSLDLESAGLTEFSFEDTPNLSEIQRINLGINELKTIDLAPLAGSDNLRELILYCNRIEEIDLAPLASCVNLEYLDLTVNNLKTIDLKFLSSCTHLTALNLGGMKLKEVDLSPLKFCTELEILQLHDNELESLDITPLFECRDLVDFEIDGIELITSLDREIDQWPEGVRKHRKRFRKN